MWLLTESRASEGQQTVGVERCARSSCKLVSKIIVTKQYIRRYAMRVHAPTRGVTTRPAYYVLVCLGSRKRYLTLLGMTAFLACLFDLVGDLGGKSFLINKQEELRTLLVTDDACEGGKIVCAGVLGSISISAGVLQCQVGMLGSTHGHRNQDRGSLRRLQLGRHGITSAVRRPRPRRTLAQGVQAGAHTGPGNQVGSRAGAHAGVAGPGGVPAQADMKARSRWHPASARLWRQDRPIVVPVGVVVDATQLLAARRLLNELRAAGSCPDIVALDASWDVALADYLQRMRNG